MIDNSIVILTDANTKIGFGHFNRCVELKKNYPHQIDLYSLSVIKSQLVKKNNWLNSKLFFNKLKDKVVLIDYPKINKIFIKKISKITKKIILFYNGETFKEVDCYINVEKINKINRSKQINGSKYVIINSEIKKIKVKRKYEFFISLGQSKKNINNDLILFLSKIKKKSIFLTNEKKNDRFNNNIKFLNIQSKKNFNYLMNQSEIIISSASQTAFEGLYLKKKLLIVKTSKNQISNFNFFKKKNITCLNSYKFFKKKKLILKKLKDNTKYKHFLLDKFGTKRIWNVLKQYNV